MMSCCLAEMSSHMLKTTSLTAKPIVNKNAIPERQRQRPKYLNDYVVGPELSSAAKCEVDYCYRVANIPSSYQEAISSPESPKWQKAMECEMHALNDNDVYELSQRPADKSVICGKRVYAVKLGPNQEELFKARYVARGYSQVEDIDYKETFSPTAKMTSIRMLMQLSVQNGLIVHQMDVKSAYLNADIDCELFVEQPEGFVQTNENNDELVFKLKKIIVWVKTKW